MKKIMFNDKYGLTHAMLEGRKTQTRRILHCPKTFRGKYVSGFRLCTNQEDLQFVYLVDEDECEIEGSVNILSTYKIGEEIAVAQTYRDINYECKVKETEPICFYGGKASSTNKQGWRNKMFVKADLMPHRIKITNIRVEHLHDISEDDCLKEGISVSSPPLKYMSGYWTHHTDNLKMFDIPREAFTALIDNIYGKGTWLQNPWVFVYDFELVK